MSLGRLAKVAGVSTATVSRVLNGKPGASGETIARVKSLATSMKFKPMRVHGKRVTTKRGMKPRTDTIALVTVGHGRNWLHVPVIAAAVTGIQRGVDANGLRLLLAEMPDPRKLNPLFAGRQIDGAVVFVSSDVPAAEVKETLHAMRARVPIVRAMGSEVTSNVDHVMPDNISVSLQAFDYLRGLGCRRLAFLARMPEWPFIRLRGQSFLNAAIDAGTLPTVYLVGGSDVVRAAYGPDVVSADTLDATIDRLAGADPRPDGLFFATDRLAAAAYPLLIARGVRPGRDIKVVSCDNEEVRLSGLSPRPASVDIGAEEIGFRAVQRLVNRIERPNGPPLLIQVSAELHIPSPGA